MNKTNVKYEITINKTNVKYEITINKTNVKYETTTLCQFWDIVIYLAEPHRICRGVAVRPPSTIGINLIVSPLLPVTAS